MKIREIEGSSDECIAYMKWYEGREDLMATIDDFESIHLPGKPATPPKIKDLVDWDANMPDQAPKGKFDHSTQPTAILPTRSPPKERTAKLEAYFRDYIRAGLTAKAIQEHLIKEHDIVMTGHQVCGWLGRMKQKGRQMTQGGSKPDKETSSQAPSEDAAKGTTTSPRSKELNLPQIKEIKRLYNKDHLRTIHIAKRMGISQEQVEAIVWQVKA
ncbi:MAG: hypothetical protein WC455_12785 [Dehalococcoidia bacterium]